MRGKLPTEPRGRLRPTHTQISVSDNGLRCQKRPPPANPTGTASTLENPTRSAEPFKKKATGIDPLMYTPINASLVEAEGSRQCTCFLV